MDDSLFLVLDVFPETLHYHAEETVIEFVIYRYAQYFLEDLNRFWSYKEDPEVVALFQKREILRGSLSEIQRENLNLAIDQSFVSTYVHYFEHPNLKRYSSFLWKSPLSLKKEIIINALTKTRENILEIIAKSKPIKLLHEL